MKDYSGIVQFERIIPVDPDVNRMIVNENGDIICLWSIKKITKEEALKLYPSIRQGDLFDVTYE